jgi:hypothetical protein
MIENQKPVGMDVIMHYVESNYSALVQSPGTALRAEVPPLHTSHRHFMPIRSGVKVIIPAPIAIFRIIVGGSGRCERKSARNCLGGDAARNFGRCFNLRSRSTRPLPNHSSDALVDRYQVYIYSAYSMLRKLRDPANYLW